jgi:ketosteroid isomerase-like protein
LLCGLVLGCQPSAQPAPSAPTAGSAAHDRAAHEAHDAYVRAINSNDIDGRAAMFTEAVVFLSAGAKPLVGKPAVRAWCADYLKALKTHWDKPVKRSS